MANFMASCMVVLIDKKGEKKRTNKFPDALTLLHHNLVVLNHSAVVQSNLRHHITAHRNHPLLLASNRMATWYGCLFVWSFQSKALLLIV